MATKCILFSGFWVVFGGLMPNTAWPQLPDSPLRPVGQTPILGPTPSASILGPLPNGNTGNSSSASPVGATNSGSLPGSALPSSPAIAPGGGLQPIPLTPNQPLRNEPSASAPESVERGVVEFENPSSAFAANANSLSRDANTDVQPVNYEAEPADGGLSPLEQRYSAWWREVLATASLSGQGLELKSVLQSATGADRVPMIREYWRLSEAIVAAQIQRETLDTWQQATRQSQQPLARTVAEMLRLQIEQANATIEAEQEHLGLWLQRHGLPQIARPVDAPFLGPYDTKLAQLQQQGRSSSDLTGLAQQVDLHKQELLNDEQVIDWAEQEWERARASGDLQQMAAMIQLRQSAYLVWLNRVTRYNASIAQYAFRIAGPGVPVPQQLAMLLRQPIVDGRLVDIRTDAWFRSAPTTVGADFREIAPVSYNQPPYGYEPAAGVTGNWQPARGR
jgi:hypothetical protein